MGSSLRTFVLAAALLTSGVSQLAAAAGGDACCAEEAEEKGCADEKGSPCPDCPPGLACSCCPVRGALQGAAPRVAPVAPHAVAVTTAVIAPSLVASAADIFHPPRA